MAGFTINAGSRSELVRGNVVYNPPDEKFYSEPDEIRDVVSFDTVVYCEYCGSFDVGYEYREGGSDALGNFFDVTLMPAILLSLVTAGIPFLVWVIARILTAILVEPIFGKWHKTTYYCNGCGSQITNTKKNSNGITFLHLPNEFMIMYGNGLSLRYKKYYTKYN